MSIRTKLIVAVSVSMTLLMVGIACALFACHERTSKAQIADAQLALATLVADDIDDKLATAHGQLLQLSKELDHSLLRDADRAQPLLDRYARIHSFFTNGMFLFDAGETVNSKNLHAVTSFKHLRVTNWIVGVNVPIAEAYAPIERARRTLFLVVAVTVLVITVLVWSLMTRLTRPLYVFKRHVEAMSGKEGSARFVEVVSRDEIGDLAEAFDRMVCDLDAKQAALLCAAHHWRATFDAIRDGLCVLDRDLHVVHANRAMHELLGAPPGELDGRSIRELLARALPGDDAAELDDLAVGQGRVLRRSGARWFELRRDPIGTTEVESGFVQLIADVTHQQVLQEHVNQAQKLEAVGQLAGGVAHDFNNLLSIILTFAGSLHDELPDGELRSFAREIQLAGQRGAALTRQLLAYGCKQVLRPEALEVRAVLGNIGVMIRRLIGEHIRLSVDLESSGAVYMDRAQLEQVLVNLAVNARDAMPGGGELTIAARATSTSTSGRAASVVDDTCSCASPTPAPGWTARR